LIKIFKMNIKIIYNLLQLSIIIAVMCHNVQGQQSEVSPKLDFDEDEDKNNTVPVVPGVKQGRNDGRDSEKDKETTESKGNKSGPKIHGVRVTVDTGDTHKSKESKESVEITDLGKNKKRVGIHTDITFEITAEGGDDHTNKTSREQDVDKEDASVPIYKGRDGATHKNRKPYDPKSHWNPNFSSERRYDHSGRANYPSGFYPEYYPNNVPVYIGSADARGAGSPIYRQSDGWTSYIPRSSYWTTERSSYVDAYNKPNDVTAYRPTGWKPCYCLTNGNDYRKRRDNTPHYHHQLENGMNIIKPTSSLIEIIDGKLEKPFSRK
ncbi:hypothetical protein DOY81_007609, partial [Sarcophaga bullata]